MEKLFTTVIPKSGLSEVEKAVKVQIKELNEEVNRIHINALASCKDVCDYITIFEEFILIEDLHIKENKD